jgi:enterochelin esterase-like enzyme
MRIRLLPTLLLAIASLPAQNQNGEGRRNRQPPAELTQFSHRVVNFRSEAVGREVPYGIYLPKGYDDEANREVRWPLVVWLHGMWEDHDRFHARGGARVLDRAVAEGVLPPCVFVLANGGRTSMYIDAGPQRNHQQLIQRDLLAHLDATYRLQQDRNQRALMGISMGGMAALRIGFQQPELFGTVAVHSSAVFPADPKELPPSLTQRASQFGLDEVFGKPIDEKLWRATNPLGIAETLEAKPLAGLRIYFDAGTEDRYQFARGNEALHQVLEKRKIPHRWELIQGGGHAWGSGFRDETLLQSLQFVAEGFRAGATQKAGLQGLESLLGEPAGGNGKKAPEKPPAPQPKPVGGGSGGSSGGGG